MPFIVEFVGPPGVGKSTIARQLAGFFDSSSIEVSNLIGYSLEGSPSRALDLACERAVSLLTQPYLAKIAIQTLLSDGTGPALSWALNLARRNRLARRQREGSIDVIREEGPTSAACFWISAHRRSFSPTRLANALELPSVVVRVKSERNTTVSRVLERGGILSDKRQVDLCSIFDRYESALDTLVPALDCPVIVVSSEETSPEHTALSLAEEILPLRS